MAQIGDSIGNYRLVEVLNSGTFGQIFRAEHKWLAQRWTAIKFLRVERLNNLNGREQFLHEAQILNQLKHPAILPILDFGLDNEVPYIIMTYASGGTLRSYLNQRSGRPVEPGEALRILGPIGEALQFAHESRIVHRDLKPENILFDDQGKPLLADFGIAIILTTNSTYLGNIGGTAPYMAPEQFRGKVYQESDQYALGCLFYEMLTGQRPFQASDMLALGFLHVHEAPVPPRQFNPQIPEHVEAALLKALAKERGERHTSIRAFLDALRTPPRNSRPAPQTQKAEPEAPTQPLADPQEHTTDEPPASFKLPAPVPTTPPASPVQPVPLTPAQPINHAGPRQATGEIHSAQKRPDTQGMLPAIPGMQPPIRAGQGPEAPFSTQNRPGANQQHIPNKTPGAKPASFAPPRRIPASHTGPPTPTQPRQIIRGLRTRLWLISLLVILLLIVIGSIVVSALGGPKGLTSIGHITADLSITPRHQDIQNSYLLFGVISSTPDTAKRQVDARTITEQSGTQQGTGYPTGSQAAKRARGTLVFFNSSSSGITIDGRTVLTGADGVQITFDENVLVPATGIASATINDAYAVQSGATGNIPLLDITGSCCISGISVKNTTAFTGGRDAIPNSVIQPFDITNAENSLIVQLENSTQADMQKQVKSNERVVDGAFQCTPQEGADHNAGDIVSMFTVTAAVACSEEVYDLAAAEQMARGLLLTHLPSSINLTGYVLIGQVVTSLVSAMQDSHPGQVSITILASGRWVYQFTSALQQQIKQAIANKSEAVAKSILRQYTGISSFTLNISSGSTLPANINDTNLTIQPVSGLQPSTTPGDVGSTPIGGNSTPGATPTGTSQGGS